MKTLASYIQESVASAKITIRDLQNAKFSSSFMNDRSAVTIDGRIYNKIKKDAWELEVTQANAVGEVVNSNELLDMIKAASELDLTGIIK